MKKDFWHIDLTPDQVDTLVELLDHATEALQKASVGPGWEAFAKRVTRARLMEISELIENVIG